MDTGFDLGLATPGLDLVADGLVNVTGGACCFHSCCV